MSKDPIWPDRFEFPQSPESHEEFRKQYEGDWSVDPLKDGEPCGHKGCLNHVSHPCEGCGRIAGKKLG